MLQLRVKAYRKQRSSYGEGGRLWVASQLIRQEVALNCAIEAGLH